MDVVVTRREWGARTPNCRTALAIAKTKGIAVHYSGSAADLGADPKRVMRSHQNFHMDTKGWCDIAYSFEVAASGETLEGRGWENRTAGQGTDAGNDAYYAVCYQGADKAGREDFTKAAQDAYARIFQRYRTLVGRWPDVKPHSHFKNTECPGDEIRAWIALEPWKVQPTPPAGPLPKWWWRWVAWRLGEGQFKPHGPRNRTVRNLTNAPRVIPPWAWLRLQLFLRARKG